MADINLLASAEPDEDGKGKTPRHKDEEMSLHVPPPQGQAPKPAVTGGRVSDSAAPKPAPQMSSSIFSQKITPISPPVGGGSASGGKPPSLPPLPKLFVPPTSAPPRPAQIGAGNGSGKPSVPPPPSPPRPPTPPAKQPPPPPEEKSGGGTLRVSLITSGAGAGFSELDLRRRLRNFGLLIVLGIAFDGLIFGGLLYWKSLVENQNATEERSVQDIDSQIAARETALTPVWDFQQLVKTEADVLDDHEHWTQALKLLEDHALPDVQYGNLSGADSGILTFQVTARDYTTLARQVVAFNEDPRVTKAVVGTASADYGENGLLKGVTSGLTLAIDPRIFKYAAASNTPPVAAPTPPIAP